MPARLFQAWRAFYRREFARDLFVGARAIQQSYQMSRDRVQLYRKWQALVTRLRRTPGSAPDGWRAAYR